MTKAELENELQKLAIEKRNYLNDIENGSGKFDAEKAKGDLLKMDERKADIEKQIAQFDAPNANANGISNRDFLNAMTEKRAITIGNNGNINQIKDLFETVDENRGILDEVTYDYGPNASTNIPVLEPTLVAPGSVAENGTVAEDTTAELSTTEIQPQCYASYLGISAEALQLGAIDIQSKLPELFRKAFDKQLHTGLIKGDGAGKNMKGIFTSASENTNGQISGGVTVAKLGQLAVTVRGLSEAYSIVMNPAIYQAFLADTSADKTTELYKETLIRDKSIEGIKIILDNNAPAETTTGSIIAVASPLSRYHVGVAGEVEITPIKEVGKTATYFQAEAFFSGKQVLDSDVFSLVTA